MQPAFPDSKMKHLKHILPLTALCLALAPAAFAGREPPVPVRTVAPDYPRELRAHNISGIVMVRCNIDAQGNVAEASIAKSSNENFDNPAMEAVKKWKFKPASENGSPVAITVTIPIKFVADDN